MSEANIKSLLDHMWQDYLQLNPDVSKIHQLLSEKNNGVVVNDHIALRTFNLDKVNIDKMAQPFLQAGYRFAGEYHFAEKKLYARHLQHSDTHLPKVFISELLVEQLSDSAQVLVQDLVDSLDPEWVANDDFCYSGRPWDISYTQYCKLLAESEYAAWLAAFGYRPNHFTVSVNHLQPHNSLEDVNLFLLEQGIILNEAGGVIKGSPEDYLEQSSTLASKTNVKFIDREASIPSCYYEFARRYPLSDGSLYQGFIAKSADKIFESTDVSPSPARMMLGV
ncbi:MAG: hypothetical protein ACI9NY_000654 [Kiritimatiellia bacterium]|jgi:hypothetical protein